MPSPFPGMDPFLEHPAIFPDLQFAFAAKLSSAINEVMPTQYYAGLLPRIWLEKAERLENQIFPQDEFREPMVEIYTGANGERLVTHIEVLSLSNKRAGSAGQELYLKEQWEILGSDVHLIETDLLRGEEPTIAIPAESLIRMAGPHDYRICLHRFNRKLDYYGYPILLSDRLPEIEIPLLPGDPDVHIDLQDVLATCYRTGRYEVRVRDERNRLEPPLTLEQQSWANEILAHAGLATLA